MTMDLGALAAAGDPGVALPALAERCTTGPRSVIIPVVDEPEDLFREVLARILEQRPTEIIVVINGPRNPKLEKICADVGVRWTWTESPGKRNALQRRRRLATGEIAVLVDSDTVWTPDTLRELVKPFRDPAVGGVTTRQRILAPGPVGADPVGGLAGERPQRVLDAGDERARHRGLPAGRTIAFRRIDPGRVHGPVPHRRFLGVFLEVSDDRTLTNYTLMAGYRTVYQSTSLVYTDAPTKLGKLAKQQYRWARGSQYNTLRMLPWMLRHTPVLAVFYVADIVVPFVLVGSYVVGHRLSAGRRRQLYTSCPCRPSRGRRC